MTPTKVLSALRQLACLGLPSKSILPEAMELLRKLVGFEVGSMSYLNDRCDIVDAYLPSKISLDIALDYMRNFHNRQEGEGVAGMTTAQAMESGRKVLRTSEFIDGRALCDTEFYNRILRPANMGWLIQCAVRDGARPLGYFRLGRPFTQPDFSASDAKELERAQPWLCHALASKGETTADVCDALLMSGESGMVLIDAVGSIKHASPGALMLLHQAAGASATHALLSRTARGDAHHLLQVVARTLGWALEGRQGPVPGGTMRNGNGIFRLHAYTLEISATGTPQCYSLYIERRVPLAQRLFRSPRFLALAPRERDVCLALLKGGSFAEIAGRLGIMRASVIQHANSLYGRLGIDGQKALLPALLGEVMA